MRGRRSRLALFGVLALALSATVGLSAGAVEAKKKKKAKTFSEQVSPNAAIPEDNLTGPSTPVISTITVGKKYKKQKVGDVNVTGLHVTGTATADLFAELTGPTGRTVLLFAGVGETALGPWTMDDDTKTSICDDSTPPCENPNATLNQPFAGTSNLLHNNDEVSTDGIAGPLSQFDWTRMRGTWTLTIWDAADADVHVLHSWGLQIKPLKLGSPPVDLD
jgi:subtilisin-like proprotein convertase family protein